MRGLTGPSPSDSHRVLLTGSHRFLFIQPLPGNLPIRRDCNPNNLPLHSNMGCLVNPIRLQHASSLSGVSTLVSISDPFSSVWIFFNTNS